jgi:hypothetical protein
MSLQEFAAVLNFARKNNGPFVHRGLGNKPCVKYIDQHIDLRSDTVFSITFRGFGGETLLHCQNECRDLKESLFERCMTYLKGEHELLDAGPVPAA